MLLQSVHTLSFSLRCIDTSPLPAIHRALLLSLRSYLSRLNHILPSNLRSYLRRLKHTLTLNLRSCLRRLKHTLTLNLRLGATSMSPRYDDVGITLALTLYSRPASLSEGAALKLLPGAAREENLLSSLSFSAASLVAVWWLAGGRTRRTSKRMPLFFRQAASWSI